MELAEIDREAIFLANQEYRRRHANDDPRNLNPSLFETKALLAALTNKDPINESLAMTATRVLAEAADEAKNLRQARYYLSLAEGIDREMNRQHEESKKTV
jgi:hypothetical protein